MLVVGGISVTTLPNATWQEDINHVIKEEKILWELDGLTDNIVDRFEINLEEESNDPSSSENEFEVPESDTDVD
ncbi:hypothetical protein C0J52_07090 [Blattella germanica]|nr:hypothetical protein C0J52_07090 [Blattella germanica]